MASITIRKLDPRVKEQLRVRAAEHGRSMEEEARAILRAALTEQRSDDEKGLATKIHRRFAALGGVELDIPRREQGREPPTFE
jgi:plasmid stability protein